mgnify:FL=1
MTLFELGQIVATPGALETMDRLGIHPQNLLFRHSLGDWGDLDEEDSQLNDEAIATGQRILSSYKIQGEKVWVITEWNRSATTILLPSEY